MSTYKHAAYGRSSALTTPHPLEHHEASTREGANTQSGPSNPLQSSPFVTLQAPSNCHLGASTHLAAETDLSVAGIGQRVARYVEGTATSLGPSAVVVYEIRHTVYDLLRRIRSATEWSQA